MGKRFLKFIRDPAARVRSKKDRAKTDIVPQEEGAALLGAPEFDPLAGAPVTDAELQEQMAEVEDEAVLYVKPAVDIEDIAPVDDDNYLQLLAEQHGYSVIDLAKEDRPPKEIIRLLSPEEANMLSAVPVREENGTIIVAISDPSDPTVTDDLHRIIERDVEIVVAAEAEIRDRLEMYYGMGEESMEDVVAQADVVDDTDTQDKNVIEIDMSDPEKMANAPRVIKLVNLLLAKAIKERASDIHIEPFPNLIRLRYRVDGVLREIPSPKRELLLGLVSRIKVMSHMNIAETRMPQDGRVKLSIDGREVDLRVSTVPTVHGEAVVMRVLDKSMMMIGISQIGMSDDMLERFMKHIKKPNGVVLVTGPTGCGKTTTLYAGLNEIRDPGEKLITVEDPVEYELPGIIQVNINENVGLTFATCLRAILRQDPDTVLVGEIRDVETAQIAVQASLTGHLVFSTLHTNSASATVTRLVDMGVKPFLITSSIEAVVGQRLVRTICPTCRAPYKPNEDEIEEFNIDADELRETTFFHGEGCAECGHTGYRGRMGLFELLEVNDEIRELILDQGSTDEIQEIATRIGMTTMRQDGWLKICLGLTTFEEVARETPRDMRVEAYQTESEEEQEGKLEQEQPKVEEKKKAVAQLDPNTMAVDQESATRVYEIGDARRTASS